jgi:hypothetical protein
MRETFSIGWVLFLAAVPAMAQQATVSRALRRSDVVFMGSAAKEVYQSYGATVVDWGGGPWGNNPKALAEFGNRVKTAHDLGIQYNAGIPMVTGFASMIAACPEYEKAICRDIDGKPIFVPWLWDQKYKGKTGFNYWFCSNSPLYQKFLRERTQMAMTGGPEGLHIDDYGGTTGALWNGGCFCDNCMELFRKYLATEVPPAKLHALGIANLDGFHYGKFLLAHYVKNHRELMKARWRLPLDREFHTFQSLAAGRVVRELQEYAEKVHGGPIVRCVNGEPPSPQAFVVMPHVDHYSCEIGMNAPQQKFTASPAFTYKCGAMIERGIAGTAAGQDWAYAQQYKATNLVRYWIAESYALGQCFMTPGLHQWAYTQTKGTHCYEGRPEDFSYLYQFVRNNAALFDGYRSQAQLGVLFSHAAWRKGKKDAQAIASCCLEANIPFALVAAGDDLLPLRLNEKDLARFEKIVVPADSLLDAEQKDLLDALAAAHKTIPWTDGPALLAQVRPWIAVEGARNVWALPRQLPGQPGAPLVVHLLNRNYDFAAEKTAPRHDLVLHLGASSIAGRKLTRCKAYTPQLGGSTVVPLTVEPEAGGLRVKIRELTLWTVLCLE